MSTSEAPPGAAAISISARDWQQIPDQDPGDGLTTVFLQGVDAAYDIQIRNTFFESFYQYWYVWSMTSGVEQDDTLYTEIYGVFETGGGDDTLTAAVDPPASQTQFQPSFLLGGSGDDVITTNDPIDDNALNAYGGSGNDSITGTWQDDALYGDEVDYFYLWPTIQGFEPAPYDSTLDGDDTISGLDGNDTIVGGGGDDILSGGDGDDLISAVSGDNQLFGGDGSDTITGGTGSDFLYGGPRGTGYLDVLSGGGGADTFMLSYAEDPDAGSDFWSRFFTADLDTVTGAGIKGALSQFAQGVDKTVATGFLSAALGGFGQALFQNFVSWLESLGPVATPKEDVLVVRDFDPSQDVLVLPTPTGVDLAEPAAVAFNPDAAGDYRVGLEFVDNSTGALYAEVTLSTDFLASVGLTQADTAEIETILDFVAANPTSIDPGTGGFTSLSNLSAYLADGGFAPPAGAGLPSGVSVLMFGAIGGLAYHSEPGNYANAFIVGTQYADILTLNPVIKDPSDLTDTADDFTTNQSEVHGLGGDDIIYGTSDADVLRGGDGDDLLYSFLTGTIGEDLAGGAGDDTLFGGGSAGVFDGGDGVDTFGVFYGQILAPMQVFIDLVAGTAGERTAPEDTSAPVGDAPPFAQAAYALSDFENAIAGPLNDWIRANSGGVVEGGAGADYIDATAGGVTLSYAGSGEAVSVQLYPTDAVASGGDAEGDVIDLAGAAPAGLIGSANADTLGGGIASGAFGFTGGGGADLFQILSAAAAATPAGYAVTDFSQTDGDLIDLRSVGVIQSDAVIGADFVTFTAPSAPSTPITITLENFTGTLSSDDILFASSVSGLGVADPSGDALSGGRGADTLRGGDGHDYLLGNAGDDRIRGAGGDDRIDGGRGDDRLSGGAGNDRVSGGDGHDTLAGCAGDDVIFARAGDDRAHGGRGDDRLSLGAGDDTATGGRGDDLLLGRSGSDRIFGGPGNDTLLGGSGADTLAGGLGRDVIDGGRGADVMRGGAGADLFRLSFAELGGDQILDFSAAEGDQLQVRADHPLAVTDLGDDMFSVTDGLEARLIRVVGATVSDFDL